MVYPSITAARDAILGHFKDGWTAAYAPGPAPYAAYQDTNAVTPKDDESWVRLTLQHKLGVQKTFNTIGNRRFTRKATLDVEVFTPQGDGLATSDVMVNTVATIFEGANVGGSDGVIFRQVTPIEEGPNGVWYCVHVLVALEYDHYA